MYIYTVDIFKQKTSKTDHTSSMISEQYGVSPQHISNIWNLKRWMTETRPFWTPQDEQQSLASGTRVESENFAESGPGPDSGATHNGTDAPLPAAGGGPHKKHLTVEQVVDIFKHKTLKTDLTSSILSEKYGVRRKAIRNIWNLKRWVEETRPFWTPEDAQQFLASGTRVESENSTQSGPGPDSGATHHGTHARLPADGGGPHKRRCLTDAQVVDIFNHKKLKTAHTATRAYAAVQVRRARPAHGCALWLCRRDGCVSALGPALQLRHGRG